MILPYLPKRTSGPAGIAQSHVLPMSLVFPSFLAHLVSDQLFIQGSALEGPGTQDNPKGDCGSEQGPGGTEGRMV